MNKQYENFIKIINTAVTGQVNSLSEPDFQLLAKLAVEQDIAALFLEGLVKYGGYADLNARMKLFEQSSAGVIQQTQRTAMFENIYKKLTEKGIKPIVLKGLICRKTYGKFENHRFSGDEDIYIEKEDFSLCRKILEENGFVIRSNVNITEKILEKIHTVTFVSFDGLLKIELHLDFMGSKNEMQKSLNKIFISAAKEEYFVEYSGMKYYTLSPTCHFLFLFCHYLKHFLSSGAGIRHVLDLAYFAKEYKNETDFSVAEKILTDYIKPSFYGDTVAIIRNLGFSFENDFEEKNPGELCEDLINGGTFGFNDAENMYANTYISFKAGGRRFAFLRWIFPPGDIMADAYPEIYEKPWKLPIYYIKRIKKYLRKKRNSDMEKKSVKSGERRIKLINGYRL